MQRLLRNIFNIYIFFEFINLGKAFVFCVVYWLIIVNAGFVELLYFWKTIFTFFCFIYEFIRQYLCHLDTLVRPISVYFPLKRILLRMKLNSIKREFFSLGSRNKSLFLLHCWCTSCESINIPKISKIFIFLTKTFSDCFFMKEKRNPRIILQFL